MITDLFVGVKTFQPRRKGKRMKTYLNIAKKRRDNSFPNCNELVVGRGQNGWILRSKSESPPLLTFSRLTGAFLNGNEVMIHLKINPTTLDFSFCSFLGNEISCADLGFGPYHCRSSAFILEYLARFNICCGLPVDKHNQSTVRSHDDRLCVQVQLGICCTQLQASCSIPG